MIYKKKLDLYKVAKSEKMLKVIFIQMKSVRFCPNAITLLFAIKKVTTYDNDPDEEDKVQYEKDEDWNLLRILYFKSVKINYRRRISIPV